jgi:hypothetical protein
MTRGVACLHFHLGPDPGDPAVSRGKSHLFAALLGEPGVKAQRRATRIGASRTQSIENAFARQLAVAPDRFRDQPPADGSESALLVRA